MEAKEIETGGQAFPVEDIGIHGSYGMTLRDYFAAKAMQGMLAYPGCEQRGSHHNNNTADGVAAMAYDYADAMISMRSK